MENSVIFITLAISVRVNVGASHNDVVDSEHGALGEATHNGLGHSLVKTSGALDIHILIAIIDFNIKVRDVGVSYQTLNLFGFVQSKCCSFVGYSWWSGGYGRGDRIFEVKCGIYKSWITFININIIGNFHATFITGKAIIAVHLRNHIRSKLSIGLC